MTPEQTQEIIQWRDRRLSPKEIARQMGLRPAEVTHFLREYNEQNPSKKSLPPLIGCFVNRGAATHLLTPVRGKKQESSGGLGQVVVVRNDNHRYVITSFLVDYWCLGVKDTFVKKGDRHKYEVLVEKLEDTFGEPLQEISLEQAQAFVFGAVDYAASLGFQPHVDFEAAKEYLGPKLDNLQSIVYGRDGQPFYFCGPYDNQDKILRTLKTHVGDGNFKFVTGL